MNPRVRPFVALVSFLGVVATATGFGLRAQAPADRVGIPWWADGKLHVGTTVVSAPEPAYVVMVSDGAVYSAEPPSGYHPHSIVHVDRWGRKQQIGVQQAQSALVADASGDIVAWADTPRYTDGTPTFQPRLVVYDLGGHRVLATRDLPYRGPRWQVLDEGSFPIAVDKRQVFYAAQDGDYRWEYQTHRPPTRLEKPSTYLIDWKAGVSIIARGTWPATTVSIDGHTVGHEYGDTHVMSADGTYAVGREEGERGLQLWDTMRRAHLKPGPLRQPVASDIAFDRNDHLVAVLETEHRPLHPGPNLSVMPPPGTTWTYKIVVCTVKPVTCEPTGVKTKNDRIILAK